MKEAYAITGYVSDEVAGRLKSNLTDHVEVSPERGISSVVMQVEGSNIVAVRIGASSGGETLVQVILRDQSEIKTVIRSSASTEGLRAFADPTIARLTASATAKKIFI